MRLIAAVITYYPDICDTIKNIEQYIGHVDALIIWENTPEKDRQKYSINLPQYGDKIIYMGTGKNEGIGYPLNRIVEYSKKEGYTHLLTMDQDSLFVDFEKYKKAVYENNENPNIGIFAPNVNSQLKSDKDIVKVIEAITSGTIYKLSIFCGDLYFREDFFIDMVDNEFCYNAYRRGIHTGILTNCHLQQKFGNTKKYPLGINNLNYSAFRVYHIIRNYIITWKEYPDLIPNKRHFITKMIFNRSLKIIMLESNKLQKFKAMYWGIKDGLAGRLSERSFINK